MTLPIIIVVLVSALMHASWNLMARHGRRESVFFGRMLLVILAVGFVPGVLSEWHARSIPPASWLCMLGSAASLALYMYALGRAYASADFTAVYPVVRGLPVILTGGFDVVRRRFPTLSGWVGMVMVVAGCFLVPLRSFTELRPRSFLNRSMLWMLLVAFASLGYNAFDKIGQENVTPGLASALRYGYFLYAFWCAGYFALSRLLPSPAGHSSDDDIGWAAPALAAVFNFASYALILWAFQLAERTGYIVAFRQTGILFGVVAAFVLFRERGLATRITGALLLTAGLLLIAFLG